MTLLDALPAGVAVLRGEALVYEFANPTYRALVGRDALLDRPFGEVWPEVGERLRPLMAEVLRTGRRFQVREQKLPIRRGPDGVLVPAWFDFSLDRLTLPGEVPARVLLLASEITGSVEARRAAEEDASRSAQALRHLRAEVDAERERRELLDRAQRQAAQLETVLSSIADGLIIYGPQGEVQHINPAAQEMMGFGPGLLSRQLAERLRAGQLLDEEERLLPVEQTPAWRALRGEVTRSKMVGMRRPDGQRIWHSVSAAPVRDAAGAVVGAVVSLTDISDLRELQEQREDLIRTLSHDVRTPLNVIVNQTELLRQRPSLERLPQRLASIATSTRRITAMIDDLVEMARIHVRRDPLQPTAVDLRDFAAELLDRLRGTLPVERIDAELAPGLPPVAAEPGRLERILVNLFGNALKYSEGRVRLRARPAGSTLEISIADEGRGICAEDLTRIFERFYRAGDVGQTEGIGLGLYVARSLAEAHGGTIRAESLGPGRGSIFTLVLPLAAVAAT
ncbi:MAG TPA: PAS domain-containing sensor histidine kinase [Anaeromyxobacteraceae bacterium]|nr:PAS domain-containing sensor histidine kinase [Anaeromyxobacteraceae bacterium]